MSFYNFFDKTKTVPIFNGCYEQLAKQKPSPDFLETYSRKDGCVAKNTIAHVHPFLDGVIFACAMNYFSRRIDLLQNRNYKTMKKNKFNFFTLRRWRILSKQRQRRDLFKLAKEMGLLRISSPSVEEALKFLKQYRKDLDRSDFPEELFYLLK